MKKHLIAIVLLVPSLCWAGDEYQMPDLIEGSAYKSSDPKFTVVGREVRNGKSIIWVVAQLEIVLNQNLVNRIIKDIKKREKQVVSVITFYTSVYTKPNYPAFRIYEHIGLYRTKNNKTHYGVAAKELYGGWSHGPQ